MQQATSAPMDPASEETNAFSKLIFTLLQPRVLSQVRPSLFPAIHMVALTKTLVLTAHKQLGAGANPPQLSKATVNTQPALCTCSDEQVLSHVCGFPLNWVISKKKKAQESHLSSGR